MNANNTQGEAVPSLPKAETLVEESQALYRWAFQQAIEQPNVLEIFIATNKLLKELGTLQSTFYALQKSPRRTIDGHNGVLHILDMKIPRSTLYKIIKDWELPRDVNTLCVCKSIDEVIAVSEVLKELAQQVHDLYEQHRDAINAVKTKNVENERHLHPSPETDI